jgi:hypothetical protein
VHRQSSSRNRPSCHTLDAKAEADRGPSSADSPAIIGR